jgi:hypothetical protein
MIKEFQKEYRWLSNFMPVNIILDEEEYSSVEHAYQSAKSDDQDWKQFCILESNPAEVRRQSRNVVLKKDWNIIKDEIMLQLLKQKFSQEPYKHLLLDTKNEQIQEGNYWGDTYWGVDLKTGEGENRLGKMIMKIRQEIKGE